MSMNESANDLLSKPILTISMNRIPFTYYSVYFNKRNILLGFARAASNGDNEHEMIRGLTSDADLWNDDERSKISALARKGNSLLLLRWLINRVLVKLGVNVFMNILDLDETVPYKSISLWNGENGVPAIILDDGLKIESDVFSLSVSISHSNGYHAVAISSDTIGLDIEIVKRRERSWQEKILSEDEREALTRKYSFKGDVSTDLLSTISWCLKESALKIGLIEKIGNIHEMKIKESGGMLLIHGLNARKKAISGFSVIKSLVVAISVLK
ncbi:MAG: 4'-phosphopantetheinyl transferase family protein [Promethearchaeota archaeon]